MTLWQGRFSSTPADELMAFTESLSFDIRLWRQDIFGSKAHVLGLRESRILTPLEAEILLGALDQVEKEMGEGNFVSQGDEDIHSAIERRVTEIAGDTGAKLHTGRSRNDQVATDLRLFVKAALKGLAKDVIALQRVLLDLAESAGDTYLPGYTHTQRAQPILVAHHMLAHGWAFMRDLERIADAYKRVDISPLGAGALGGSTLPLKPDFVASKLEFAGRFRNSLDAVSDRDFVAETLFVLATIGIHLSRIGEEIVLWSTEEFSFVRLDDAYSTGSSMLPNKKNPDIAELSRGKVGRLIGNLTGLLATLKGLPLSYNRDLQEDKEPLFDSLDTVTLALKATAGMLATANFDYATMKAAADSEALVAIDLAEFLVMKGIPFRKAHGIVGGIIRDSIERRVPISELVEAHPQLGIEALEIVEPGGAIRRRVTAGGSGIDAVREQVVEFTERLKQESKSFEDLG